jgi:FKBP-type peptidyl-prolyl cis-trans isomerase
VQKKIGVAALASIALLLAGCQSAPIDPAGERACEPSAPGVSSDAIQVSGKDSVVPSIDFEGALTAYRTQRTVAKVGGGRMAEKGSLVTFSYAAFDGSSGELIDSVGYDSAPAQVVLNGRSLVAGVEKALLCATEGSRVTTVVPAADAFGESGNDHYGISATDLVVLVVDVVDVAADRATGERQTVMDSLPRVDVGATGEPLVTIPPKTPPAEYSATVLKLGEGDVITAGATVSVEYRGVEWGSGRTFDTTWHRDELVRMPTTSYLKGIGDALVGKTVGSQILVILPPAFGFGKEGNPELGIDSDDTMVFVIDILATVQLPTAEAEG